MAPGNTKGTIDMNHHPTLHIERMAHDHHAQLIASAAARRHEAQGRRRSPGAVRTTTAAQRRRRMQSALGLAVVGMFTFAGSAQVDASASTAGHICDVTDAPSSERSFGRFVRAI
jgi:hypothetical protein